MKKGIEYSIYGAPIGDFYGSYWEFLNKKPVDKKDAFKLKGREHDITDDTICTIAIAKACLDNEKNGLGMEKNAKNALLEICGTNPAPYGQRFYYWLQYGGCFDTNSLGNGASMRISPVGLSAKTIEEARENARLATKVSHSHPIGIVYAEIVAQLVFMAKEGNTIDEMKAFLKKNYPTEWLIIENCELEDLHKNYTWHDETSQNTVPQAIYCFLSSDSFEDCLYRSLYVGGDSDTLCAISCSIAAPYYGDEQLAKFLWNLPHFNDLEPICELFKRKFLC